MILTPPAIVCEVSARYAPIQYEALLTSIASVETGNNDDKEGGRYQFTIETWRSYTDAPFERAKDYQTAHRIALTHAQFLAGILKDVAGGDNDMLAYFIAVAWNAGYPRVLNGEIPKQSLKYADSVFTLYCALRKDIKYPNITQL
jgi:hypothetical protein